MHNLGMWLRWSWRDLRARWLQVLAIALIIALGAGVFAGVGGQKTWRIDSYDLSYSRLHMYDLKMALASGSYVEGDALLAALQGVEGVQRLEVCLIEPTVVDASNGDETILVRGRIVGVEVRHGGPYVNGIHVPADSGRALTAEDSGKDVAVVEYKFARHYKLEPGDPIRISGGARLDFVGAGHSPEYFMVMPETGTYFGESDFAVLFVPLETAQRLARLEGMVNDAVIVLEDGADRDAVRAAIEQRMASAFPTTGFAFTLREDDPVYTGLYSDAEGDQWMWDTIATLFLLGAAMGAFNLAGRMVEAQRREIGIGMALGVPRRWIALRPLLVGLQIAVLGTILGLLVGQLLNYAFTTVLYDLVPLPFWDITFYLPGYIRAALLGMALPVLAVLVPVVRAVRVAPVDAIKSGYLVARSGGLSWLANRLPLPGKSFVQMPLRNILRSPWRTLLTTLGIAIAILVMTFMMGALDSYLATMQRADDAYRYRAGDRILVDLDRFYPIASDEIATLKNLTDAEGRPLFTASETVLLLGGRLIKDGQEIDTALELHDMAHAIWVPDLVKGQLTSAEPGIIISEKAAHDLDVSVGDTLLVEHPRREGLLSFRLVQTELPVTGIHNNPLRPLSYMDLSAASLIGLEGVANQVVFEPAPGAEPDDIKAAVLLKPGVSSVKSIADFSDAIRNLLEMFTDVLAVIVMVVVVMAFLIAFNSTSLSVDERVREIATMFAFGLPVRTVARMQMLENVVIGVLGTVTGVAAGWLTLLMAFIWRANTEIPDLKLSVSMSSGTVMLAAVLGVVVVGLTPLFSIRRLRRLDIPSTLRVME